MTTTTPTTYTITAAENALLEAAIELSAYLKTNGNGFRWTVADYIGATLPHNPKPWREFEKALDAARAAEDPCGVCEGAGEVARRCCSGRDCGCEGRGVTDACGTCDGRGWVL